MKSTTEEKDKRLEKIVRVGLMFLVIGLLTIQLLFTWAYQTFIPTDWPDQSRDVCLGLSIAYAGIISLVAIIMTVNNYAE